jgi:hypothetical protein
MAQFAVQLNLDIPALQETRRADLVRAGSAKVSQAAELLRQAREKCEPVYADGRFGIEKIQSQIEAARRWLGLRLAISEAFDGCLKAETLLAFNEFGKAGEILAQAQGSLDQAPAAEVQRFEFLQADRRAAEEKMKQLREALDKGAAGAAELAVLPLDGDAWRFCLDPKDQGKVEAWFKAGTDRRAWARITVPGLWEKSGIAGTAPDYDGLAWYARTFEVPPAWRGQKVLLHVGAVDDEAEAWVNGEFVGDHLDREQPGTAWDQPFEFDLTPRLQWEGSNELVLRVNDTHLGGGIWKSVYLRVEAPGRTAPGPGDVEIKAPGAQQETAPAPARTPAPAAAAAAHGIAPGWSVSLSLPGAAVPVRITMALCDYGKDPENTAGRPLSAAERQYLTEHGVGRLAVVSFSVRDQELIMPDRYPGFWPVFSFRWDGYQWNYHSLETAVPSQDAARASLTCRGRVVCANYARLETWMAYEYEITLYPDGRGSESLTLIPDHDTGFAPNRKGPPDGYAGLGCAVDSLALALRRLPARFATALLAPLPELSPRPLRADFAADRALWTGTVAATGLVGAWEPGGVYLALFVPRETADYAGEIRQFDAQGYPGDELELSLLPALLENWPAGSRQRFVRWFAVGSAHDVEGACAALQAARQHIQP